MRMLLLALMLVSIVVLVGCRALRAEPSAVNDAAAGILNAMREVQRLTEAALSESQSVSASTEEQAAAMSDMSDASGKLAELAQELQNEVQRFRL